MPPYSYRHGAPVWIDLTTSDLDKAQAFYKELLGWEIRDSGEEMGHYHMASANGQDVAGMMAKQADMGDVPDAWTVYFGADDANAHLEAAKAAGGSPMIEVMDVADLGKMAVLQAPDGSVYGVWQPGTFPGIAQIGETGAPAWFENQSKDYEKAVAYYPSVTGVSEIAMPEGAMVDDPDAEPDSTEFKYFTGGVDGDQVFGICDVTNFMPEEVPSHWEVYFLVDDTDEAVAKIKDMGGSVVSEPQDSFFGRFAIVTDPTGAFFRVIQPVASHI